mmetsp:Transcript_8527/g.15500  ORF Transcript_8527/g.15500 Transcript_8527/m.15500 type:complete len:103 (+) Transcript_8527:1561-1869(+)
MAGNPSQFCVIVLTVTGEICQFKGFMLTTVGHTAHFHGKMSHTLVLSALPVGLQRLEFSSLLIKLKHTSMLLILAMNWDHTLLNYQYKPSVYKITHRNCAKK